MEQKLFNVKGSYVSWFKIQIPISYVSWLAVGAKVQILVGYNSLFRRSKILCQTKLSAGR